MGMILRIASSRIVGQGDIVGRSGYFSLNLSANSVMRGRLDARRTLKSLVADLRYMNKRELTALIAERTGFKKKDVHTTLQATIDCISEVILAGGRVTFMGFGSFYTQERGPRISYNVYSKERRHLDSRKVIKFKPTLQKRK